MFLVHVNVCDFADTMLIVVQINLILIFDFWFFIYQFESKENVNLANLMLIYLTNSIKFMC